MLSSLSFAALHRLLHETDGRMITLTLYSPSLSLSPSVPFFSSLSKEPHMHTPYNHHSASFSLLLELWLF
jgi:hypothetical protein